MNAALTSRYHTMRPLQRVDPTELKPGRMYLIQEKRPEYRHLNCKGTFVKNQYPSEPYMCTMTTFTNVVVQNNKSIPYDIHLQDTYWNYYEADAVERATINHVLRQITGDPDFTYS